MKETSHPDKTQCGCQPLTTRYTRFPKQQQRWIDTLSLHDLLTDLGPSSELWFDDLTEEHEHHRSETTPNKRQAGWSPCPAGGVVNVAASTPCPLKTRFQYESPALWPSLLPHSPVLAEESASPSSQEDNNDNNSTAFSCGFDLQGIDDNGTRILRKDKGHLLAFSMDSTHLSWTSSMATPPNAALEKFSVKENEERQKGPARALFSPNTSADSELVETDVDMTIEQEEVCMSPDASRNAPPFAGELVQPKASCAICRDGATFLGENSCLCQVPVVEIHDANIQTVQIEVPDRKSQVGREIDLEDGKVRSWSPVRLGFLSKDDRGQSSSWPGRCVASSLSDSHPHSHVVPPSRRCYSLTSTPVRKTKGRLHSLSRLLIPSAEQLDLSVECLDSLDKQGDEAHGHINQQTPTLERKSSSFETSTPNMSPLAPPSPCFTPSPGNQTPTSHSINRRRASPRKRVTAKNLAECFESEKTTKSVDEALADFFSSQETAVKRRRHAPRRMRARSSARLEQLGAARSGTASLEMGELTTAKPKTAKLEISDRGDASVLPDACLYSQSLQKKVDEEIGSFGGGSGDRSHHQACTATMRATSGNDSQPPEPIAKVRAPGSDTHDKDSDISTVGKAGGCSNTERDIQERGASISSGVSGPQEQVESPCALPNTRTCTADGGSPVVSPDTPSCTPGTPRSILRSSGKLRDVSSSSSKRVRFAKDCVIRLISRITKKAKKAKKAKKKRLTPDNPAPTPGNPAPASASPSPAPCDQCAPGHTLKPGHNKAMQPKLQLGLKRRPRFLYPTSSQIMDTCPERVYRFQPASTSLRRPSHKSSLMNASTEPSTTPDNKPSKLTTGPDGCSVSTNNSSRLSGPPTSTESDASAECVLAPGASTASYTVGVAHLDKKAGEADFSGSGFKAKKYSLPQPAMSFHDDEVMDEDPDWSEIEDCAMDVSDGEVVVDGQKTEGNIMKEVQRAETCSALSATEEPSVNVNTEGSGFCEAEATNSNAGACSKRQRPVKDFENNRGLSFPGPHSGMHPLKETECSATIQHVNFHEQLQDELLSGMDFSQELLSQSKVGAGHEATAEKDATVEEVDALWEMTAADQTSLKSVSRVSSDYPEAKEKTSQTMSNHCATEVIQSKPHDESDNKNIQPHEQSRSGTIQHKTQEQSATENIHTDSQGQSGTESIQSEPQVLGSTKSIHSKTQEQSVPESIQSDHKSTHSTENQPGNGRQEQMDTALLPKPWTHTPSSKPATSAESDARNLPEIVPLSSGTAVNFGINKSASYTTSLMHPNSRRKIRKSEKSVNLSSRAQQQAMVLWESVGKELNAGSEPIHHGKQHPDISTVLSATKLEMPDSCGGFLTAGGNAVNLPSIAQRQAIIAWESLEKELGAGSEFLHLGEQNAEISTVVPVTSLEMPDSCGGFKTARGKSVNLSSKVQQKAMAPWESVRKELNAGSEFLHLGKQHPDASTTLNPTYPEMPNSCKGFNTAGGKSVNLSSKAQQKALALWESVGKELNAGSESIRHGKHHPEIPMTLGATNLELPESCGGFKRAGGRSVNLSSKAQQKAIAPWESFRRELNAGSESIHHGKQHPENPMTLGATNLELPESCGGFKTAGGRSVNLSSKAQQQAMDLWESVGKNLNAGSGPIYHGKQHPDISTVLSATKLEMPDSCGGFLTAGGNAVNLPSIAQRQAIIAWESLEKELGAGSEFLHLGEQNAEISTVAPVTSLEMPDSCGGFKTARGKSVNLSSKAQQKALALWESVGKQLNARSESIHHGKQHPEIPMTLGATNLELPESCGDFKRAAGRSVNLSSKAQQQAMDLWESVGKELNDGSESVHHCDHGKHHPEIPVSLHAANPEVLNSCGGFKTAGGKSVNLSSKAEQKAMALWESVGRELSAGSESLQHPDTSIALNAANPEISNSCGGFKTARGKSVNLSSKAEQKAMALWESVSKEVSADSESLHHGEQHPEISSTPVPMDSNFSSKKANAIEKPVACVAKSSVSPLRLMPPNDVPQGFRPFRLPTIVKKVSEEERYQLREVKPSQVQKNTLLNHFSKGKLNKDTRSSKTKQRHSDEFSDDDEAMWGIEMMDKITTMENNEVDDKMNHKAAVHDLTAPDVFEAENREDKRLKSVDNQYSRGFQTKTGLKLEGAGSKDSMASFYQQQYDLSAQGSASRVDLASRACVLKTSGADEEEMSEAVLTELTHDLCEATQAEWMQKEPGDSLEKHTCLEADQMFSQKLSSQDSHNIMQTADFVDASVQSSRCNGNVSSEDKNQNQCHADFSNPNLKGKRKRPNEGKLVENISSDHTHSVRILESDLPTLLPDVIGRGFNSVNENIVRESVNGQDPANAIRRPSESDQEMDIQSSFVDKDTMLDMSCLENELDSSFVEVSGGVVWVDECPKTQLESEHGTAVVSWDAVKEERDSQQVSNLSLSHTESEIAAMLSDDCFNISGSYVEANTQSVADNLVKMKPSDLLCTKTFSQTAERLGSPEEVPERPITAGPEANTNTNVKGHLSCSENPNAMNSLGNLAWTDMTSVLNPSQWNETMGHLSEANTWKGPEETKQANVTVRQDTVEARQEYAVPALAGSDTGSGNEPMFSVCASPKKKDSTTEDAAEIVGSSDVTVMNYESGFGKNSGAIVEGFTGTPSEDHLCTDTEGFECTTGLSQFFLTPMTQAASLEVHNAGCYEGSSCTASSGSGPHSPRHSSTQGENSFAPVSTDVDGQSVSHVKKEVSGNCAVPLDQEEGGKIVSSVSNDLGGLCLTPAGNVDEGSLAPADQDLDGPSASPVSKDVSGSRILTAHSGKTESANCDSQHTTVQENSNMNNAQSRTLFPGLQTANGRLLKALQKSEKVHTMFGDDFEDLTAFASQNKPEEQPAHPSPAAKACGSVKTSRSHETSSDKNNEAADRLSEEMSLFTARTSKCTAGFGFQTASGKSVSVSEASRNKVKHLFQDEEELMKGMPALVLPASSSTFKTASVSSGTDSQHPVSRAQNLLETDACSIPAVDKGGESISYHSPADNKHLQNSELSSKMNHEDPRGTENESVQSQISLSTAQLFPGFQTARGTSVSVSEKALKHAQKFLESSEDRINLLESGEDRSHSWDKKRDEDQLSAPRIFPGFQTAKGTSVSVSEKALKHTQRFLESSENSVNLLESGDDPSCSLEKKQATDQLSAPGSFPGFQTAKGTSVSVSEKALKHARKFLESNEDRLSLLGSGDSLSDSLEKKWEKDWISAPGNFPGFQTAGGMKVSVSKSALIHTRNFLSSEDPCQGMNEKEKSAHSCDMEQMVTGSAGFRAASVDSKQENRLSASTDLAEHPQYSSSSDSRISARNRGSPNQPSCDLPETGQDKVSSSPKLQHQACSENSHSAENEHFEAGKDVSASKQDNKSDAPPHQKFQGFLTAGGMFVSVSDKALKNARKVLDGASGSDLIDSVLQTSGQVSRPALEPSGFQTARGTNVSVSQKALQQARAALCSDGDFDTRQPTESKTLKPAEFGFQTAGGGSVTVSHKSLQYAQSLFKDDTQSHSHLSHPSSDLDVILETRGLASSSSAVNSEVHLTAMSPNSQLPSMSTCNLPPTSSHSHGGQFSVATSALASTSSGFSSTVSDSVVDPSWEDGPPMGKQERKGKESLQPVMSDDSQMLTEQGEQAGLQEVCLEKDADRHRLLAKRKGVYTDPEAILHDRATKRSKFEPTTGYKHEFSPAVAPLPQNSAAPRKSAPSFQPPYKKPRFAPPATKDPSASVLKPAPQTPGFRPPPYTSEFRPPATPGFRPPPQTPRFRPPALSAPLSGANTSARCGENRRTSLEGSTQKNLPEQVRKLDEVKDGERDHSVRAHPTQKSHSGLERSVLTSLSQSEQDTSNVDQSDQVQHLTGQSEPAEQHTEQQKLSISQSEQVRQHINQSEQVKQHTDQSEQHKNQSIGQSGQVRQSTDQSQQFKQHIDQPEQKENHGQWTCSGLEEARMKQEKIIRDKKRRKVVPVQGRWLTQKTTLPQTSLAELLQVTKPARLHKRELLSRGVSATVCAVNSCSAQDFRFYLPAFYPARAPGVLVGDGALLVADHHGYAGKQEFYRAFLTMDGVDPGLVTEAWVHNHYRWIVWKLAAYEVVMPHNFASRAVTPDVVMFQLRYRYDREVDGCQRSAVKRIVERDDTPCKRLVLCISDIVCGSPGLTMLEVTDGWYSLPCKPDSALQDLIDRKKLAVGQKIVTSGAELAGGQEACSPLELCPGLHLKVFGNCTRPAPAQARLGYQRCPTPLCVPLSTLHPQGGLMGCANVLVVKKHPLMFMEKSADSGCVFRSLAMEEKARQEYEDRRQRTMEKLCSGLQAQMEKEEEDAKRGCRRRSGMRRMRPQEIQALTTGAEIIEAVDSVAHPEELMDMLSASQVEQLMEYRQRQQEERQQDLNHRLQQAMEQSSQQAERTVVPVQKLLVSGCCRRDLESMTRLMVTVWRPGPDWDAVQEGKQYRLYSLTAHQARSRDTPGQNVELTAGRQSRIQAVRHREETLLPDPVIEPKEMLEDLPASFLDMLMAPLSQEFSTSDTGQFEKPTCNMGPSANSKTSPSSNSSHSSSPSVSSRTPSSLKSSLDTSPSLNSSSLNTGPSQNTFIDTSPSGSNRTTPSQNSSLSARSSLNASSLNAGPPLNTSFLNTGPSLNASSPNTGSSPSPSCKGLDRKRAVQMKKLARLQAYSPAPCLSPLPRGVPPALNRAFKPPTPHRK